ncbi:hypothetical protein QR680_010031 [Steinernema hermaphroditum]|uniref:LRRCT domain-containing protein n=1 Tax=Steinernema hermaphroditum TaxID=289476 RepID=A0AA39IQ11_9BILA|nr:hypothetical protein QR680_010031 [Steinernema hermaphroditum]
MRLLILIATFVALALGQCPALSGPCRCAPSIFEPVAIICENAGSLQNALQAASAAKGIPIDSLTIIDTAMPSINANAFAGFTIIRLVLNRNTISRIDPQAFAGTLGESLIEIDLSDNQLREVPTQSLAVLQRLKKLYLNRNRLTQLSPSSFIGLDGLLKLELAGNKLTDSSLGDGSVFRPLRTLNELSLGTNSLTVIPSAALVNQRETMVNLNLGSNQINTVPLGALDFPNLSSLSLEFNGISDIRPEAFQGVPILQYLYLTGNKFPQWNKQMFRYIGQLRTLAIGGTPIQTIPADAFESITNLIRFEMSEAAVLEIQQGAFQRTPNIQAIIMNKNRLSVIRSDYFQGLDDLYAIDLEGNRIAESQPRAFANLRSLRNLDISNNQLQTMPQDSFDGSFIPEPNDRMVIFACRNPWLCDSRLEWFRRLVRDTDIDIDKPGCTAVCENSINNCPPIGTPLKQPDVCQPQSEGLLPSNAANMVPYIILSVLLSVLMISILLLALIRYAMSHANRKRKVREADDVQSVFAASAYQSYNHDGASQYPQTDIDLPPARTLEDHYGPF